LFRAPDCSEPQSRHAVVEFDPHCHLTFSASTAYEAIRLRSWPLFGCGLLGTSPESTRPVFWRTSQHRVGAPFLVRLVENAAAHRIPTSGQKWLLRFAVALRSQLAASCFVIGQCCGFFFCTLSAARVLLSVRIDTRTFLASGRQRENACFTSDPTCSRTAS